jgi:hypothetical protein
LIAMHRKPRCWPATALVLGVILLGCATAAAPARRHGMTTPSTTQSTAPRTLHFADAAVPLDRFRDDDHDVDLRNVISFPRRSDVYFGQCERQDPDGDTVSTAPLVVAAGGSRGQGSWLALDFSDPRLPNAEWQFVATGPAKGEVWGVLDDTLTSRGAIVLLVHSTDSGATWTISPIAKPFESGEYDSFAMDSTGHGRLTIYLAPTNKHPRRAGFYHFRTTDGGKTWSTPEHESDALEPADEVPSDEAPEPLKSVPTQTASLSR